MMGVKEHQAAALLLFTFHKLHSLDHNIRFRKFEALRIMRTLGDHVADRCRGNPQIQTTSLRLSFSSSLCICIVLFSSDKGGCRVGSMQRLSRHGSVALWLVALMQASRAGYRS